MAKTSVTVDVKDMEKGGHNELEPTVSPASSTMYANTEVIDHSGKDEALELAENLENVSIHPEKDRRLRLKMDLILLPILGMLYLVQFMDKTCVSYSSIMGIVADYSMVGQMYSWTTSCFYLGYLCASPLSAYLLQRLPPVWTTATCIIIWGLIQCLITTTKSYATFVLLRTLLGIFESFVSPIFVIVLNQYYKKSEHFGRMAIFYGCNGLGTIILSAIAGGIYNDKDNYSYTSYNILFLIVGLWTILMGLIVFLVIPNNPSKAKWLSIEEKAMVVARIRVNQQGFGAKKFKKYQLIECISDVRTWIYFLIGILVAIPNGGVSSFGSILLSSFGFKTLKALYMKAPVGAIQFSSLAALVVLNAYIKSRMLLAEIYMLIVLMAACLLAFASRDAAIAGYWILGMSPVGIVMVSSCVSSNTAGHTKKMTANAISLIGYSCGNIVGPQTFRSTDAPNYKKAKATIVGCYSAAIVLIALLAFLNIRENKKRDTKRANLGDDYVVPKNQEFADLTDFENPEFRYAY